MEARHEVSVIVTCKAAPEYGKKEEDYRKLAQEKGIPFICDVNL